MNNQREISSKLFKIDTNYIINYYEAHVSYLDIGLSEIDFCFANNIFIHMFNMSTYFGRIKNLRPIPDFLSAMKVIPS
jgi:hypothetical protein